MTHGDLTPARIAELRRLVETLEHAKAQGHGAIYFVYFEKLAAFVGEHGATLLAAAEERDRLRARLHHDCKGCPGCSSNDCPDALDMLRAQRDELVAALEQCDVFLRVHAKPDNPLKAGVQAALRAAKEATE